MSEEDKEAPAEEAPDSGSAEQPVVEPVNPSPVPEPAPEPPSTPAPTESGG